MDDLARYFDILEIRHGAPLEEIKRAYRDLAQVWHPDRYGHNPRLRTKAEEKLKRINEAYQRLSTYYQHTTSCNSPPQKSPPPRSSNTSTAHTDHTETHEAKPPPTSSPQQPPPTSTASKPQTTTRPSEVNAGCIVATVVALGFVILIAASQHDSDTRYPTAQQSSQPQPTPSPSPPPPATTTSAEQEELSQMKTQIVERVARKDAEFDRLEKWYREGVSAQYEANYKTSLSNAQREEQEIEALILTYNAKKKELDAKNPSK